jgi:hypothetical protein
MALLHTGMTHFIFSINHKRAHTTFDRCQSKTPRELCKNYSLKTNSNFEQGKLNTYIDMLLLSKDVKEDAFADAFKIFKPSSASGNN